jgi:hypothetical protein
MKIFRKLRRAFIEQQKLTKYLTYALGEIILVVIGILIALQINNLNEAQKSEEAEARLIEDLRLEFQENLKELDKDILRLEKSTAATKQILGLVGHKNPSIGAQELDSLLMIQLTSPTWNPSVIVLEELKNSGGYGHIQNPKLKIALLQWERYYSNILEMENAFRRSFEDEIDFLKKHGSLRSIDAVNKDFNVSPSLLPNRNLELLQNYEFENCMDDVYVSSSDQLHNYIEAREIIVRIIEESGGGSRIIRSRLGQD